MADLAISQEQQRERDAGVAAADLVVGIVWPPADQQSMVHAVETTKSALASFSQPVRAAIVHYGYSGMEALAAEAVQVIALPGPIPDLMSPVQAFADVFRAITSVARNLNARACAIVATGPENIDEQRLVRLAGPVLDGGYDLVAPCYMRRRFEALVNKGILYPLVRALYGRRVRNPFGPDFCLSSPLVNRVPPAAGNMARVHPAAWLLPEAITGGYRICQSHMGLRPFQARDEASLSTLLSQLLASLFGEIERRAAFLQRVRGSQPVDEFGAPVYQPDEEMKADVSRLVESFQVGARNLQEIWSMVLPPSTIVELKRLARASPGSFHIDDVLWARIVYDFALAYRLRSVTRDHLLRAMTPLYLGWVASFAANPDNTSAEASEHVIERLCLAYESARPYFLGRWRWPDRFNP